MSQYCAKFLIKGRVQGVGFRFHTAHEGLRLTLTGYARNLPSGDVEVVACGSQASIERLALWLQEGPKMARVDSCIKEELPWQHYEGFAMH
ncbi:acylphosphatase [Thaumasiovibrio subtropicus]|uniref:acylphosphatase n=1 Tax=Thaumasiovibrio subtropicus TaxID=1891207 RepID=UPI000B34C78B|nr:acylphosphatase [Thaumasiovibrio subtropicus]